jgi:predicted ABC-type transport system involved in lysophospholipase L1 biosynthesis ATPase subunit
MTGTGLTLVIVTHDTAVARRAQQSGVMKEGRLLFQVGARGENRGIRSSAP